MLQKMALSVFLGVCKTSVISTIVDVCISARIWTVCKTSVISTIVDASHYKHHCFVCKTSVISTIVDRLFLSLQRPSVRPQ